MSKSVIIKSAVFAAAISSIAIASPAVAQGGCDRATLQGWAEDYLAGQAEGQLYAHMNFGEWVEYTENMERTSMVGSFVSNPIEFDHTMALLDESACGVYIEGIALDPEEYVIGVRFRRGLNGIDRMETLVTDEGDWLFDAKKTLQYAQLEDWGVIPEDRRNTRAEIVAAADAYLDLFKDKGVEVPWGTPCARLEGGIYTGKGEPDDSCNVGVPDDIELVERYYVVDTAKGAVAVWLRFGGEDGLPDIHTFRVEDGKIRYIHTLTNCGDEVNCGFPPLAEMLADNPDMQPDIGN